MKKILLLLFIFITTNAYAENWVCYDDVSKQINRASQGDCLNIGLCTGFNNTGLPTNCFEASQVEYDKARTRFVKFDPNVVSGSRIIDMTQAEKDAITDAQTIRRRKAIRLDAKNAFSISGVTSGEASFTVLKSLVVILMDEINILRNREGLAPRTLQQLKNALELRIDAGEFD